MAAKAEAYLEVHRHRRHRVLRPRGRVLRLRRRALRDPQNAGYYYIDSIEGAWNTGRVEEGGNRGYKTPYKGGYFPVPPVDHFSDLRDQMSLALDRAGLDVERAHHEVGTAGQAEINYRFDTLPQVGRRAS